MDINKREKKEQWISGIDTILFDLDGTLTDSGAGIMNSVRYALRKFGRDVESLEELRVFIGPPLAEQFQSFCKISAEESVKMVEAYREYYSDRGIFENEVYPGLIPVLESLKQQGKKLAIATSKPEKYARMIAEHFGFSQYFTFIGGALMDGRRTKKSEVIEYVLETCGETDRNRVLMIGDRDYDIIGAREAGIHSMGVLYGYGECSELEAANAEVIVETPEEIEEVVKCY